MYKESLEPRYFERKFSNSRKYQTWAWSIWTARWTKAFKYNCRNPALILFFHDAWLSRDKWRELAVSRCHEAWALTVIPVLRLAQVDVNCWDAAWHRWLSWTAWSWKEARNLKHIYLEKSLDKSVQIILDLCRM